MAAPFARVTDTQFRAWILKGRSVQAIAAALGCTREEVIARRDRLWKEAQEKSASEPPTPEEIEAGCLEAQARWSEEERRRRAGCRSQGVEIDVVPASCLTPRVRGFR